MSFEMKTCPSRDYVGPDIDYLLWLGIYGNMDVAVSFSLKAQFMAYERNLDFFSRNCLQMSCFSFLILGRKEIFIVSTCIFFFYLDINFMWPTNS